MVNDIAPLKTVRIENTSSEWFDRKVAEKLSLRRKLLQKSKSSRLSIEMTQHRNDVLRKTIKQKKMCFEDKLS